MPRFACCVAALTLLLLLFFDSAEELENEVLFSRGMHRHVTISDLDLSSTVTAAGVGDGDGDDGGYDPDDDLSGAPGGDPDDQRSPGRSPRVRHGPCGEGGDDLSGEGGGGGSSGDESDGADSDDGELLPENLPALRQLCEARGLPSQGTRRTMQKRLEAHASKEHDAAAVAAAAADRQPPRSRKQTKRDQNQERLVHAIESATDSTASNAADGGLAKRLRHLARQINAWVHRQSRERTGSRNRFVEVDVRDDDRGGSGGAAVHPIIEVGEAPNYVRLCKRLHGGGSHPNSKRMASALGLHAQGDVPALRTRIELRLRELEFDKNVSFLPLHEHVPLGEDDFHDLCEEGGPLHGIVHTMADVECVLRDQALRGGGS